MRKLLIALLLILCAVQSQAGMLVPVGGGVVAAAPAFVSYGPDAFNSDTSGNFTALNGSVAYDGTNHYLKGGTGYTWNDFYYSTSLDTANQVVQATLLFETGESGALCGRITPNGGSTTGYCAFVGTYGGGTLFLVKFSGTDPSAGTNVAIDPNARYNVSGGHTLKLDIKGTAIKVSFDGSEYISTTDSTYATGNYAGYFAYGTSKYVDDFYCTGQ